MVILRTLGALDLSASGGGELTRVLSQPKRFAILAYLAVARPPGLHRRDTLLSLFWPEMQETRARNALSQSLSFLRRELPARAVLSRGNEEIGLDPSAVIADVAQFRGAAGGRRWSEALRFYGGEFLIGFHIHGAPGFEEWAHAERDLLRDSAASCAWALARDQILRGAFEEGERTAKMALGMVCPDENTVGRFIELLMASGERVSALRLYERFSAILMNSMGLTPSPGLRALKEQLRTQARGGAQYMG
jgi:DNA-binding SARP family transcriptional activator